MMQEGLLWFDDTEERTLAQKLARAAARYQQKYGHALDVCYVHPQMLDGSETTHAARETVKLLIWRGVLMHHLWLCLETPTGEPPCPRK